MSFAMMMWTAVLYILSIILVSSTQIPFSRNIPEYFYRNGEYISLTAKISKHCLNILEITVLPRLRKHSAIENRVFILFVTLTGTWILWSSELIQLLTAGSSIHRHSSALNLIDFALPD